MKLFLKLYLLIYMLIAITAIEVQAFEEQNNNNVKIQEHGLELTQTINIQRQEFIQRMCDITNYSKNSLNDLTEKDMEHLLIDKQHKFLYCYVPKVACSNWKRVLMILNNKWKNGTDPLKIPASLAHSPNMFQKLSDLTQEERIKVLADYTKFILVRHPFERLLSAYRNKLEGNSASAKYFQFRVGRQIISHFRKNPNIESLEDAKDVTFDEFIEYILTPKLSQLNHSFNEHWEPASKLCHPCIIKYNVVGKYETLLDDSALALYLIGADKNLTFPSAHKPSTTSSALRKYFDPISVGAIRKLYEVYRDDFRLFDYELQDVLGFEFG